MRSAALIRNALPQCSCITARVLLVCTGKRTRLALHCIFLRGDAGLSPQSKPVKPGADATPTSPRAAELTRALSDHDLHLHQLQACISMVRKFDEKAPIAQFLLTAVREWQSRHTPGQPHLFQACSSAVASALLNDLMADQECPPPLHQLLSSMLSGLDMTAVPSEISLCTTRLNAKKTAAIAEHRSHLCSPSHAYLPTMQLFLAKRSGEKLHMRPQGAPARKATGRK